MGHENTTTCYVSGTGSDTPSWGRIYASAVIERGEYFFGAAVGRGFSEDGDSNGCYAEGMQSNRGVVEVAEDVDAEGVDDAVRDEDGGVDADCLASCGGIGGFDRGGGGDESC